MHKRDAEIPVPRQCSCTARILPSPVPAHQTLYTTSLQISHNPRKEVRRSNSLRTGQADVASAHNSTQAQPPAPCPPPNILQGRQEGALRALLGSLCNSTTRPGKGPAHSKPWMDSHPVAGIDCLPWHIRLTSVQLLIMCDGAGRTVRQPELLLPAATGQQSPLNCTATLQVHWD
jgi:hypothetical protein